METSPRNSDRPSSSSSSSSSNFQFAAASNFLHSPLSSLLEFSGVLHTHDHPHSSANDHSHTPTVPRLHDSLSWPGSNNNNNVSSGSSSSSSRNNSSSNQGEVSVSIIGATGEQEENHTHSPTHSSSPERDHLSQNESHNAERSGGAAPFYHNRDSSSYLRYDIQQAERWMEQLLPFSLLLLLVFIRQHLQGFIITIWVAAFMFKSNHIVRKQTALKGERRHLILFGLSLVFTLHVISVYWWYLTDLLYLLVMIPPKAIQPFWHAIFVIVVNDTLVRQAAMVFKCGILMYYKNSRGRNYREQVSAAGDLCAICQEKMLAPILLRCKHIFCEDCVSEWFERERTCPLCRALVKSADLRSFGDGSTSLFFQLF